MKKSKFEYIHKGSDLEISHVKLVSVQYLDSIGNRTEHIINLKDLRNQFLLTSESDNNYHLHRFLCNFAFIISEILGPNSLFNNPNNNIIPKLLQQIDSINKSEKILKYFTTIPFKDVSDIIATIKDDYIQYQQLLNNRISKPQVHSLKHDFIGCWLFIIFIILVIILVIYLCCF